MNMRSRLTVPVRSLLCSYKCFNTEGHSYYGVASRWRRWSTQDLCHCSFCWCLDTCRPTVCRYKDYRCHQDVFLVPGFPVCVPLLPLGGSRWTLKVVGVLFIIQLTTCPLLQLQLSWYSQWQNKYSNSTWWLCNIVYFIQMNFWLWVPAVLQLFFHIDLCRYVM